MWSEMVCVGTTPVQCSDTATNLFWSQTKSGTKVETCPHETSHFQDKKPSRLFLRLTTLHKLR